MPPVAPREAMRRMTHASVGLLALSLRWMPWPAVVVCCFAGIAFNIFILPRVSPGIFREDEHHFSGIRAYPMAVLLLVLLFPLRIAAGSWAILALGDSMAALVGRTWGKTKLPWNREKSLQGLLAFVAFGTCAGALAYSFVELRSPRTFGLGGEIYNFMGQSPWVSTLNGHLAFWSDPAGYDYTTDFRSTGLGTSFVWIAAAAAASAAAIAESIYVKLDDNFRTALVGGFVLLYLDPLTKAIQAVF